MSCKTTYRTISVEVFMSKTGQRKIKQPVEKRSSLVGLSGYFSFFLFIFLFP